MGTWVFVERDGWHYVSSTNRIYFCFELKSFGCNTTSDEVGIFSTVYNEFLETLVQDKLIYWCAGASDVEASKKYLAEAVEEWEKNNGN